MSINSAVTTIWDVLKYGVVPIKRQCGYVVSSKSYANDLQEEVQKLANEAQRVHMLAEVTRNNPENFYSDFTEWQASAEKALKEAPDLLGDFEKASKSCCHGILPDPKCRYQFSRKVKDKIKDIRQLAQKGSEFRELNDICFRDPALGSVATPTPAGTKSKDVVVSTTATASTSSASTSIKLRDDDVFESRASIIRDIMEALADYSNSVVGVHGMGGVGKSTLLEEVKRRISEEKLFDCVTMVDVSANPDIRRIQGEIADALGCSDIKNEEYLDVRANLLHLSLEHNKLMKRKVLIILDNLWGSLDLNSVGIPCGLDNKIIGCKLLLSSRDQDVLRREMGCDRDFLLPGLQGEEARRLFESRAGDKVHDDDFKPLVDEALHKCAGLPFLILAMAKLFKDTSLYEWQDALKQIETSTNEGIGEVINKMLQWSYDHLKGEEVKSLLRLCVVCDVPEPSPEYLVRYGVGLGLFRECSSMEEARHSLSSLVNTLQASSFLLDNGDTGGIKLHDLVREFVASVTSRDDPLIVLKDKDQSVTELPKNKLKSCTAICFPYVGMKELPQEFDCPEMRIFLLFMHNESVNVSDSLFNSMTKLMVLDLSGIHLTCLPSSFQFLKNLQTLCLDDCSLEDVAILSELKGLQILSFANSKIQRLPKEIGQLVELRLLDLNHCSQLQVIEPGVLGRLIKLEELYMESSFDQWNAVEQTPPMNASLIELKNMKNLCTLHVSIPNPSVLPEDLIFNKITKYNIQIGRVGGWLIREGSSWLSHKGLRRLELQLNPTSDILRKGSMQTTLDKTDDLLLDRLNGIEQSICDLYPKGFPKLKHLYVWNSPSIHYILRRPSLTAFKMLESLLLKNLRNLEKICHNHISSKSFSTLKIVRVESCDKMKVLFPLSLVKELPLLEEIKVNACNLMREIVEADDCGKAEFRNLHVLELSGLSNIKNFFTAGTAPSSSISDDQVGTQVAFFNGQQNLCGIVQFHNLKQLEVKDCDNLRFMFFPSMVKSLAKLRDLIVVGCKKMETIIVEEEGLGMETSETLAFPMLTYIELQNLENLTCFSHGKCLQEAWSQDHVQSRSTALFNREVAFPSLETVEIRGMDNIEMIWDNQVAPNSFHNLNTPTIAGNLVELTNLSISNCQMMTEVISDEGGEERHTVAFKQLKYMQLSRLTGLRGFSSGGYTLMFPLLEHVIVTQCLNMKFFSEGLIEAPKLGSVQVQLEKRNGTVECKNVWKENLNITIQNMFEEMDTVAVVEFMRLSKFPELIEKWHSELIPIKKSSWRLKSLVVDKCPSFMNAIPFRLMPVLDNMRRLQVCDCESLEEIFNLEGLEALKSTQVLFWLCELALVNLPNLNRLWNQDLQGTMCFSSLTYLTLYNCSNLRHAFAPSMVRCLDFLKEMEIKECDKMEGVIAEEEGQGSAVEKINFRFLRQVKLECLPNLTSFLSGKNHTLKCPVLDALSIAHCPKMRSLTWKSSMEIDHGTPSLFTPQVQFPQLRSMILSHMDNLSNIWTSGPRETLTFETLRELEIQNCNSLENLFPYWVATRVDQLEKLRIQFCVIKEIVASGDDTPHSTTVQVLFPKLTSLVLHDMPQLQSFCPNLPALNWPFLTELRVTHCDKLNMLSFATFVNKWTQKDDQQDLLDQEAQSSFERDFPNLERLLLIEKDIQMIQHGKFPDDIFSKLKALILACFHDENAVFPPRFLLERFQNLQSLEVFCSSFEDIFPDEGFVDEGKHPMLENLRELKLIKLHKLKHVWRENHLASKILQSIKTFEVMDCPSLTTLFPAMTSFQKLTNLVVKNSSGLVHLVTFSAVTNLVHLINMTIMGCEKMKEVVTNDGNGAGKVISLGKLKTLRLQYLPSLVCFSSITSCIFRFPSLELVVVEECPKMKIFSKGTLSTPKLHCTRLFKYIWEVCLEGDLNTAIQKLSA
ncbi:uncharacterized protein LOC115693745 [Syzygium oleosum]|uniref:uncharacterized protein LOC115693745 n=1 Tax=Syzygium oleosum TaxID=219896 RepID=UPI0024BB9974|nr:uncharacterized protein LOC115693745 [Syzygium oleosum]